MLIIRDVTKIYRTQKQKEVKALDQINYEFDEQGFYAILGKSGSGKSTLLNLIAGLDKPTSGEIILNGKSFSDFKRKDLDAYRNAYVGFIFQEFNLFDNLDVYKNVALALELQGRKAKVEEIEKVLDRVGISDLIHRNINELSGGQKQRVAIARALIKNPKIIIADEPTGALDQETTNEIFDLLKGLSKEYLVIVVTHNEEYANQYAEHILHLSDGKQKEQVELTNKPLEAGMELEYKKSLSIFSSLKMGFSNLKISIVRLVLCILLTTMAFSSLGFCLTVSNFSMRDIVVNSVVCNEYEDPFVIVKDDDCVDEAFITRLNDRLGLNFKGVYNFSLDYYIPQNQKNKLLFSSNCLSLAKPYGILETNEAYLKKLNFTITGTFPQSDDEILITEYYYNTFARYGFENEEIQLNADEVTKEKIIGQTIQQDSYNDQSAKLKITGIVDTGFNMDKYRHLYDYDPNGMQYAHDFNLVQQIKYSSYHSLVFVKEGTLQSNSSLVYSNKDGYDFIIDNMPHDKKRIEEVYDYLDEVSSNENQYHLCFGLTSSQQKDLEAKLLNYQYFSGIAGAIFSIFSICLMFTLLNFTVERKKREMGVLRALGAKSRNIFFIFSSEGIYLCIFSLILSYIVSSIFVIVFNNSIKHSEGLLATIYHFEFIQFLIVFIISIITTCVSIFIPVLKVTKKSPAEAIRMEIK
ncbi:MAG: ATP-binding cassette domain-containing protein [Anaeroplasmataceae bacterium]|nr:ATP-binding cassette domain-containing protein [Anaeroplasmataceae bacterium]